MNHSNKTKNKLVLAMLVIGFVLLSMSFLYWVILWVIAGNGPWIFISNFGQSTITYDFWFFLYPIIFIFATGLPFIVFNLIKRLKKHFIWLILAIMLSLAALVFHSLPIPFTESALTNWVTSYGNTNGEFIIRNQRAFMLPEYMLTIIALIVLTLGSILKVCEEYSKKIDADYEKLVITQIGLYYTDDKITFKKSISCTIVAIANCLATLALTILGFIGSINTRIGVPLIIPIFLSLYSIIALVGLIISFVQPKNMTFGGDGKGLAVQGVDSNFSYATMKATKQKMNLVFVILTGAIPAFLFYLSTGIYKITVEEESGTEHILRFCTQKQLNKWYEFFKDISNSSVK